MCAEFLPATVTNEFRGPPLVLFALVPVNVIFVVRSLLHMFLPDGGAQSIASVPLDAMGDGAATVVSVFALWGLSQLLIAGVAVVVMLRYRSLVPLMWVVVAVEATGRFAIQRWKPIGAVERPPGAYYDDLLFPLGWAMVVASQLRRE